MNITINVTGTPAPQGSKKGVYNKGLGRVQMVESSKKVAPWRQDVVAAALNEIAETGWTAPAGPLRVDITFYLPRPRYHFRTGKRANELRDDAPHYVDKKPDKDKLERATCDALTTSGIIRDDAQIAEGLVRKVYANGPTGAQITITPLDAVAAPPSLPLGAATAQGALL